MKKFTVARRPRVYGRDMPPRLLALVVLAALALPVAAASAAPKRPRAGLRAFASCAGLRHYALSHAPSRPRPLPMPLAAPMPVSGGGQGEGVAAPSLPAPASAPGGGDTSATNVQEAGIDEPDIVKTDGSRIFAVARGALHAIDATTATPRLLDTLRLPDARDGELLLGGDRLLLVTPAGADTRLTEVDVSDPSALRVVHTMTASGSFVSARQHGATARIVLSWTPPAVAGGPIPVDVAPAPPVAALPPGAMARAAKRPSSGKGWVPGSKLRTARTGRIRRAALVPCSRVRHTASFSGLEMLTVLTVDLARGLPAVDSDAVMASGENVYASAGSLYVASTRWGEDGPVWTPGATTAIHRWDISSPERTEYRSSGEVPGHLLNQFSMSERNGFLRVATTTTQDGSSSRITVLDDRSGGLAEVGSVGGIGRGEQIYAVRFLDDAAYVVTFRQMDPLFTLDLSDPAHPVKRGELQLRGYSSYLHPAGDGLLIGIGQDAGENGVVSGAQLSLFDVSDAAHPVRLAQRSLGAGARSPAETEHHAFLWWPKTRLAVVPVDNAAVGLRVGRDGIADAGRVEHPTEQPGDTLARSLVVRDRLVTLSDSGLMVGSDETLGPGAWLKFPPG